MAKNRPKSKPGRKLREYARYEQVYCCGPGCSRAIAKHWDGVVEIEQGKFVCSFYCYNKWERENENRL